MRLTKQVIHSFESEQKVHGTKIALSSLLWAVAADMLRDIRVKNIKTTYRRT
jgi:hypothetical protein